MEFVFNDISFTYSPKLDNCLKNISFSCNSSAITGLAGANGSGKTTLIKIMLGQLVDFKGRYLIGEKNIRDFSGNILSDFGIGYAPDNPVLDDTLTGFEILSLVADIRHIGKEAFDRDIDFMSECLHIEDWLRSRKCGDYSSGMRKMVSLAIAYLGNPSFAVLDEPTNGLDPISVFGLKKLIAAKQSAGTGSLIASHILDFVEKTASSVLLLKRGVLAYSGGLDQLKSQWPNHGSLEEIYFTMFNTP
jgi:ABC-type multidrug transport system ATPase subunit